MRWPWQRARPGMVSLRPAEYIRLLEGAVRAAELEDEIRVRTSESRRLTAQARAVEVLGAFVVDATGCQEASDVVARLPMTDEGVLHEPALLALYEAELWARRERELAALNVAGEGPR